MRWRSDYASEYQETAPTPILPRGDGPLAEPEKLPDPPVFVRVVCDHAPPPVPWARIAAFVVLVQLLTMAVVLGCR